MLLLTACSTNPSNDSKENETLEIVEENDIEEDDKYQVEKEYTTSEGYRRVEYEYAYETILSPAGTMTIVKNPEASDYTKFDGYRPEKLPEGNEPHFAHDLRSKDIAHIDLSDELDYLLSADFDDDTKWPDNVPKEYNVEKIKKYGMDPGLGIREIHESGITGQGVGIAIIDSTLLVSHLEYKDQIKLYEEIHLHVHDDRAQMHGPAVASIAVGKNVGVAPDSDLYYIACEMGVYKDDEYEYDMYWTNKSIDRIIEINKTLPMDKKIRVISISLGIENAEMKNHDLIQGAIKRAYNEGIYVIHAGNSLFGVGREVLGDPNDLKTYTKGYFWGNSDSSYFKHRILAPMDSRCIASPTGEEKYVFYRSGGLSWAVPYTAGLYALSCQVNPNITPEKFNDAIVKTASKIYLDDTNEEYKIVNPEALLDEIRK